jgi:hypothetical protein
MVYNNNKEMKLVNVVFTVLTLAFALVILSASLWQVSAKTANLNFKVTPLAVDGKPFGEAVPTVTPTPKIEYPLVYPGILPDSALYPIKMIRDRLVLTLTTDSLKKAEVMLLFADKRLGAAKALIEGGKTELGVTTATKGEKYLVQAVNQAIQAKKEGKETSSLKEKLSNACLKHQEIILELLLKTTDNNRQALEEILKYSEQGYGLVQTGL